MPEPEDRPDRHGRRPRSSPSSATVCAPTTPARPATTITSRLAIFVTDPESGKIVGGIYGGSYLGQLSIERVFLPESLRRYRLGSRLLAMAEEEARRRGCSRITLNTLEIQARGFYLKQGFETAATLDLRPARRHPLCDDQETGDHATRNG